MSRSAFALAAPFAVWCSLAATASALQLGGKDFPMPQQGGRSSTSLMGGGVPDFADLLRKPGVVVAFGTIKKVNEGKRERLKDSDAQLGDGGATVKMSGTVYYKVDASAEIAVAQGWSGKKGDKPPGEKLTAEFTMQLARLNDGSEKSHLLVKPQIAMDVPLTALFVLEPEKGKKSFHIAQCTRFDAKEGSDAAPNAKTAKDYYLVNRRVADLREAIDAAEALIQKKDSAGAAKILHEADDAKVVYASPEFESTANGRTEPLSRRVKQMLTDLDAAGAAPAAPDKKGDGRPPV